MKLEIITFVLSLITFLIVICIYFKKIKNYLFNNDFEQQYEPLLSESSIEPEIPIIEQLSNNSNNSNNSILERFDPLHVREIDPFSHIYQIPRPPTPIPPRPPTPIPQESSLDKIIDQNNREFYTNINEQDQNEQNDESDPGFFQKLDPRPKIKSVVDSVSFSPSFSIWSNKEESEIYHEYS